MTSPSSKRRDMDLMKLMMSDFEVRLAQDNSASDFYVQLMGPEGSPYQGGVWNVHVTLPPEYPYKSPSIGFCNKIFHPNVDQASGSVCLDVINQTWSPMFDLVNIFSVFLPQLLLYPNAHDPLNGDAAAMLLQDPASYEKKVKEFVDRFARPAPPVPSTMVPIKNHGESPQNEIEEDEEGSEEVFSDVDDDLDMEL